MNNCMDCQKHQVISDRDPDDWFCADDVAIVCTLTANPKRDNQSRHLADHSPFRAITVACRPYKKRKEADRPDWCPINLPAAQAPAAQQAQEGGR